MRTNVGPSAGAVVAGTIIHIPGSTWMPTAWPGVVTSLITCRYGTPLRKASAWVAEPRLGTEPKLLENVKVSEVRFSSSRLSPGGRGIGNFIELADFVLSGRKIVLKPPPFHVPTKLASGPRGGTVGRTASARAVIGEWSTALNSKSSGSEISAVILMGLLNYLVAFLRYECR